MTCILFYRNFLWSLTTLDDSLRLSYTFLLMIKICTAYFTHTYKCFDSSLSKYCWPFNIVVISLILKRWWFDIYEMLLIIFFPSPSHQLSQNYKIMFVLLHPCFWGISCKTRAETYVRMYRPDELIYDVHLGCKEALLMSII